MSEFRPISIRRADIEALDESVEALFRAGERTLALKLGALALRARGSTGFHHPSFVCDVDESAGVAEVVEISGYSRKAGA